jgi:hypothetical protein
LQELTQQPADLVRPLHHRHVSRSGQELDPSGRERGRPHGGVGRRHESIALPPEEQRRRTHAAELLAQVGGEGSLGAGPETSRPGPERVSEEHRREPRPHLDERVRERQHVGQGRPCRQADGRDQHEPLDEIRTASGDEGREEAAERVADERRGRLEPCSEPLLELLEAAASWEVESIDLEVAELRLDVAPPARRAGEAVNEHRAHAAA